jgi:hypothetical protein
VVAPSVVVQVVENSVKRKAENNPCLWSLSTSHLRGRSSWLAMESTMYLLSLVLRAISDCSLEAQQ